MEPLPELAFAFARFVAQQQRPRFASRNFGIAAFRRRTFGSRRHLRLGRKRNGGLNHRRAPWSARRRYYGHAGGHRRRRNYRQNHHRGHRGVQRHHSPGTPGPSARPVTPVAAAPVAAMPVATPAQVAVAPVAVAAEVAAVQEAAPEEMVDAMYEDEGSASNFTADTDDLLPPPPAFSVPPMEWLLGGPSAAWLVDDPERDSSDEEEEATPPLQYFLRHGYGPCLPSPTPSDEVAEHFAPPGYADVTKFFDPPVAVPVDATPTALPDLNLPAHEVEEEKNEDAAPSVALPTPSPEARVILRRFASAMAASSAGIRAGTWSPVHLGLIDRMGMLSLDDPSEGTSRQ